MPCSTAGIPTRQSLPTFSEREMRRGCSELQDWAAIGDELCAVSLYARFLLTMILTVTAMA